MYIKDSVICKTREYGAILFDVKSGKKMKLNRLGTRIFFLYYNRHKSVDQIIDILASEYDADRNQIEEDVNNLIHILQTSGMTTNDIAERGVLNLLEVNPSLDTCTLVITQKCNLECKHCFLSSNKKTKELSTEDIKKVIDDLSTLQILNLVITGGEPFMREDILDVLRYCNLKKVPVTLFTNGTLIDEKIIESIKELRILLRVSLDGATMKTNDCIRGYGVFEKALWTIEKSVKAGIPTGIATTIYQGNFPEYKQMVDLAEKMGCYEFEMSEVVSMGNAKKHPEILLSPEQIQEIRSYTLKRSFDHSMIRAGMIDPLFDSSFDSEGQKGRDLCSAGRTTCAISPEGDVYPCQLFTGFPEFCEGNVIEAPLEEIWVNGFKRFREMSVKDIRKCTSCECSSSCAGGCRARAYAASGDLFAPMDDVYCTITRDIWKKFIEEHGRG